MCGELRPGAAPGRTGLAARAAIGLIRGYQAALSPWLGLVDEQRYRATLRAVNPGGRSAKVRLRFRVVRR